jgi:hypothetical protein
MRIFLCLCYYVNIHSKSPENYAELSIIVHGEFLKGVSFREAWILG